MLNKAPFVKETEVIGMILAIIDSSLPLESSRNKATAAIILIDILSRVPQEEFINLKEAIKEYNALPRSSQQMVASGIRANLTKF